MDRSLTTSPARPTAITVRRKRAARMLGISERKLGGLTRRGEVPCIRLGGVVLYSPDALRCWAIEQSKAHKTEGV